MNTNVRRAMILACGCLFVAIDCSGCGKHAAVEEEQHFGPPPPVKVDLPIFVRLRAKAKTEASSNEASFREQVIRRLESDLQQHVVSDENKAKLILDIQTAPDRPRAGTDPAKTDSERSIRYWVRLIVPQSHAVALEYPSIDLDWKHINSSNKAEADKEAADFAKVIAEDGFGLVCDPSYLKTRADGSTYLDLGWHSSTSEYPHAREYKPAKQRVCLTIDDALLPSAVRWQSSLRDDVLAGFFYDQFAIGSELVSDPEFADVLATVSITKAPNGVIYHRVESDGSPSTSGTPFEGTRYTVRCEVARAKDRTVSFTAEARGETKGDMISTESFLENATDTTAVSELKDDIAKKKLREGVRDATLAAAKAGKGS